MKSRGIPHACGALGDFKIGRVSTIASALGRDISVAHRDESSILLLDRPPIRWRSGSKSGWTWSEGLPRQGRVRSWREAARELAGCGVVRDGRARYVHSSVAGLAPVYFLEHGDATYFATRIDALLAALPPRRRLSIDWRAWAAIFLLTAPLGDRTPFLEVRRLPPFSRLDHRPGKGARVRTEEWPWASEPDTGRSGAGPDALLEALREALPPMEGRPVSCPLSGGWDSRLLLMLARERELDVSTMTLEASQWRAGEEGYAAMVAAAAGIELEQIPRPKLLGRPRGDCASVRSPDHPPRLAAAAGSPAGTPAAAGARRPGRGGPGQGRLRRLAGARAWPGGGVDLAAVAAALERAQDRGGALGRAGAGAHRDRAGGLDAGSGGARGAPCRAHPGGLPFADRAGDLACSAVQCSDQAPRC